MKGRRFWILGLALVVVGIAAYFASEHADTLEHFLEAEEALPEGESAEPLVPAPLPDYQVEGVEHSELSTILAGAAGTLVTFGLLTLLVAFSRGRTSSGPSVRGPEGEAPGAP